jgi:hypothetical protein
MAHTIPAIVAACMDWYHEIMDTSTHALSMPAREALPVLDAVAPKVVLLRLLGLITVEKIWDIRIFTAGVLLGLVTIFTVRYLRSPWRNLPPSPPGLPILGNARQILDKKWLFSRDCKEQFGESLFSTPGILKSTHGTYRRYYVS